MGHKVLQDTLGAVHDVNVAPVNPGVVSLESRVQQIVASTANGLTAGTLSSEAVTLLHAHLNIGAEILADDGRTAEANFFIGVVLDTVEFGSEVGKSVILGVTNQESQIDELVGVGQLGQEIKVLLEVGGSIAQRGQDEHALPVLDGLGGRDDGVEVNFGDGGVVHFVGFVVVEQDRGLGMGVPLDHFVDGHFHRRLG